MLLRRLLVPILAIAASVIATGAPAAYFWPPVRDIAVFKDGCAYIIREGEAEAGPDGVVTEYVPQAILGTLDVYSLTSGARIAETVAFYEETEETVRAADAEEFYRLQIGRRVILDCGQEKRVEGTLQAVLAPGHLLVETAAGAMLVPLASVTRLTLPGQPVLESKRTERRPRLRIRLAGAQKRARLGLSYLEETWTWHPSYRINLRPKDQAELVLTATVVNNGEGVKDATLHLIVGYPNFMMRGTPSPMALTVYNVNTGRAAPATPSAAALFKQAFDNRLQAERAEAGDAYSPAVPAGSVEDLFVYEKGAFSLDRGERMQIELYRGIVPCESVYKWQINQGDPQQLYNQRTVQQQKYLGEQGGEIWHYLRLVNKTPVPWTTAPAMVVSDWQPLAQDLMKYVNIGGQYDLRTTIAPEIRGEAKEEETSRKVVRLFNNDDYLQITIRGTLLLENLKKNAVKVEVSKDLWGEVKDAGGAACVKKPEYLWQVNPHSILEWTVNLPAGGRRTLTYTYDILVNI